MEGELLKATRGPERLLVLQLKGKVLDILTGKQPDLRGWSIDLIGLNVLEMNKEEFSFLTQTWSESARRAAALARKSGGLSKDKALMREIFHPAKGFQKDAYGKLPPSRRTAVLKAMLSTYKSRYIPKSAQGGKHKNELWQSHNKDVGKFEAMRSNLMKRASGLKGAEQRKVLHLAISFQGRAAKSAGLRDG